MERTYFIYKLTSPNGKVYIGQTYNINRRFSCYRTMNCKEQLKIYSSIYKYGWDNFKKEIIFDGITNKDEIDIKEEYYIKKYIDLGISLNISKKVNSPIYLNGINHPRSKPVIQFDLKLNIIQEWESACIAANALNIKQSCISLACRTSHSYSNGFYWRFKNGYTYEDLLRTIDRPHGLSEPIIQLSKNNEFIKEWESQALASRELKINQANIWRVLCGIGISAGGFKWIKKANYEK